MFAVILAQLRDWDESLPGQEQGEGCMINGVPTLECIEVVFGNLLIMSSALVVIVLFVMFLIGSFSYLTSLGDPEKMKNARNTFTFALVGLGLFLCAYVILFIIDVLFLGGEGTIFNFNLPGPMDT